MAARDRDAVAILVNGCDKCKEKYTAEQRQRLMSCGFEQPVEGAKAWKHPGSGLPQPSACVAYLVAFDDVVQASRLRLHWKNGGAAAITGERERFLIEELEIQARAAEAFSIRTASERPTKGRR